MGLGALLAILLLEIGLRLFWRPELTTWQRNLNVSLPLDPEVTIGVTGPARIITNAQGIRGDEWASNRASEYRILAIGASNTRCLLQDQPNTWAAVLQTQLSTTPGGRSVWVGNVGGAGYTSRHMALQMRYMLEQYDPDSVIIMAGNDWAMVLKEGDDYDPHFIDDPQKMQTLAWHFTERPMSLVTSGKISPQNTYIWSFLREFRIRFFKQKDGMAHTTTSIAAQQELRRNATQFVDELTDIQLGLEGYRYNLTEMVRLAQQADVHLVLMAPHSFFKPNMTPDELNRLWAGQAGDPDENIYWSPAAMSESRDLFNAVLLDVCATENVDCIDLAASLPQTTAVFWDQSHLTDYGSSLVAAEVAAYFSAYFEKTQQ